MAFIPHKANLKIWSSRKQKYQDTLNGGIYLSRPSSSSASLASNGYGKEKTHTTTHILHDGDEEEDTNDDVGVNNKEERATRQGIRSTQTYAVLLAHRFVSVNDDFFGLYLNYSSLS